jgi:hypothetical protein
MNEEILRNPGVYLRREKNQLRLMITKARGAKSPKNRRDSLEENKNHLGGTLESHKRWSGREIRGLGL